MARHTADPDVDPTRMNDDALATYINDVAPVAANLPDGEYGKDQLTANAEAAIAEFQDRHGIDPTDDETSHLTGGDREPSDAEVDFGETVDDFEDAVADAVATDGGTSPVDEAVEAADDVDDDHYLTDVTDEPSTFSGRHERMTKTTVVDGTVAHTIFESAADDADTESLRWSRPYFASCPVCDADVDKTTDDGDQHVEEWDCTACVWSHRRATDGVPNAVSDDQRARPLWSKTVYPHDFDDDPDIDFDKAYDGADTDADAANMIRSLWLNIKQTTPTKTFADDAYVSPEYDDDMNKTADAYFETFACGRCGDEREAPAKRTHEHFGDVCPACEDATVWSIDDADLPDDVVDRMNTHKSFSVSKITKLLRDVNFWGNYVAAVNDDVDLDDVGAIKTGKGGKIAVVAGAGKKGSGLRRPKGAAYDFAHFRTLLRDAAETGIVEQVGDGDVDDPNTAWKPTDKGREVFDQIARCETCGETNVPMKRVSTYSAGRRSQKDTTLTVACPACDDLRSDAGGPFESSSSNWSLSSLPGVAYDET